jgi:meso-butanediol dehydrogenase / (S,S)-butanediol dehydrogenase / diacetyl reductase
VGGRLEGKIALITGSASGQGREAAIRFAKEGAKIVGCDLNPEMAEETVGLVKAAGGQMVSQAPLSVSDEPSVQSWIDFAVSTFGDFDILYNNASGCRFAPIEEMTREQWDYTLANELTLVFLAIKHAVPVFRRKGSGCILNTASVAGLRPSYAGGFAHSVTKAGVITLTQNMAVELAPLNVRVNAISPGCIETPGLAPQIAEMREAFEAATLNHRIGQSEDIAAAAVYLCSDEARHLTGVNLVVDGGTSIAPGSGRAPAEPMRYTFH